MLVAESIAGDTVIGHCGSILRRDRRRWDAARLPARRAIRGIALEIERLANHVGDLGAIAGDVAFQPAAAFFGRMRGEYLNLLMTISGNRYGRGLVRPGGVGFDIPGAWRMKFAAGSSGSRRTEPGSGAHVRRRRCKAASKGLAPSPRSSAWNVGFVGPVARACEVVRDVRNDHPYGIFRFAHIPVSTGRAGDVYARTLVRWLEVRRSLEFVIDQLAALPKGEVRAAMGALRPDELVVALQEGWRGEIAHVAITDGNGDIRRYKVTDPSFHNWTARRCRAARQPDLRFPRMQQELQPFLCGP